MSIKEINLQNNTNPLQEVTNPDPVLPEKDESLIDDPSKTIALKVIFETINTQNIHDTEDKKFTSFAKNTLFQLIISNLSMTISTYADQKTSSLKVNKRETRIKLINEKSEELLEILDYFHRIKNITNKNSSECLELISIKNTKVSNFINKILIDCDYNPSNLKTLELALLLCNDNDLSSSVEDLLGSRESLNIFELSCCLKTNAVTCRTFFINLISSITNKVNKFEQVIKISSQKFNEQSSEKKETSSIEIFIENLKKRKIFTTSQIRDLANFRTNLSSEYQSNQVMFLKSYQFFKKNILILLEKINNSLVFNETDKNINTINVLEIKNDVKDLFYYFEQMKEIILILQIAIDDIDYLCYTDYFFQTISDKEIKEIFSKITNSITLHKTIKNKIKEFKKQITFNSEKGQQISQMEDWYQKQPLLSHKRKIRLYRNQVYNKVVANLNCFFELNIYSVLNDLYQMLYKLTSSQIYLQQPSLIRNQIPDPSESDEMPVLEPIPADSPLTPNVEEKPSVTIVPAKTESKSESEILIEELELLKHSAHKDVPLFKSEIAKSHFVNAEIYFFNLLNLMEYLLRHADVNKPPETISMIACESVKSATFALEQLLSSILAEKKSVKTQEELRPFLTHNLLELVDQIDFKPQLTLDAFTTLRSTCLGEIWSRQIVSRIAGHFNPEYHYNYTKKLLEMLYLYANRNPRTQTRKLLKEYYFYFTKTLQAYIEIKQYIENGLSTENKKQFETTLRSFTKKLKEIDLGRAVDAHMAVKDFYPELQECLIRIQKDYFKDSASPDLENIQLLIKLQNADIDSMSSSTPEELAFIYSRVLQQNQIITEQFLYLILELKGKYPDSSSIDHDLSQLYKLLEIKLQLNSDEQNFLNGKSKRNNWRYLTPQKEGSLSTSSKKMAKKKNRKKKPVEGEKKEPALPDGYSIVKSKEETSIDSLVMQMRDGLINDCRIMNSVLNKLINHADFSKNFTK